MAKKQKKIENLTDEELRADFNKQECKRTEIVETIIKPAQAQLTRIGNRKKKLEAEFAKREQKKMAKTGKVNWEWLLYAGHGEGEGQFKAQQEFLADLGLHRYGFQESTEQAFLSVSTWSLKDITKTLEGLKKVIPHLKPIEDGYVHVYILNDRGDEYSSFSHLRINRSKRDYRISRYHYHKKEPHADTKFSSLKKALEYIKERYSYNEDW
jgi:hypothetical protein